MSEDELRHLASSDTIMAEATLWFGRMRGPEADLHKAEFERWLARGALHRSFYNRAGEIYAMGKFLKDEQGTRDDGRDNETAEREKTADRDRRRLWVRRAAFASLAVVAAITFGSMAISSKPLPIGRQDEDRNWAATASFRLETGADQAHTQRLPDGSRVTLSPDSLLLVDYGDARRSLRLERGSTRFEVAHERRPFVVLAGDGRITARGTIFEVGLRGDQHVTVRLLQGKIDVATPGPTGKTGGVRHLNAGETLSYPATTAVTMRMPVAAMPVDPSAGTKPDEALDAYEEFDGTQLATVVALVNQRGGRPIRLASLNLGGLKVSGRFRLNDPQKLARKFALLFNLEVVAGPENEIDLRRP